MGDDLAKDGPGGPENRRITVSYLAGFLDGEGCVYARMRKTSAEISFEATQAAVEPLQLLVDTFGGSITSHRNYVGTTMYRWRLSRRVALRVAMTELIPHLRVKREQVRLALELIFLLPSTRNRKPLDSSTSEAVHRLVGRITVLKRV